MLNKKSDLHVHIGLLVALSLVCVCVSQATPTSDTYVQSYPDGTTIKVQLYGETGEIFRVTTAPQGKNASFKRYDGWIANATPAKTTTFTVTKGSNVVKLVTSVGMSLTLSTVVPTVSLNLNDTTVARQLRPTTEETGTACLPTGWTPLEKGQAASLNAASSCLRITLSLDEGQDVYGFGQTPQPNSSAVGSAMLMATSAANLDDGQSHTPAPFYISMNRVGQSYGLLLNTIGYSMFDVGNTTTSELRVHSGDPVMDVFFLAGPSPVKVITQLSYLCGRPPLPPPWALGFKYHTQQSQPQAYIEDTVSNFAKHAIPLAHVVIENYYNSGHQLDPSGFPHPKTMVETIATYGAKVVVWIDPHVHRNGTQLGRELEEANCVSDEWADTGGCGCNQKQGCGYSDLTLDRCQQIWSKHVDTNMLALGIAGFKLDQDDGGVVLFRDNTTFPSGFVGRQLHNM